jgi:anaerobic C4-dicarboxylate transporter
MVGTNIILAVLGGIALGMIGGLCLKFESYLFEKHLQEMKDGKRPWS